MKRTLPLVVLISLTAASPTAKALGLADPQVHSSLNEPLQARIAVTDLRGLDPTLLKARLADEAVFEQAGLPRSALAESVRMALEHGAGGMQLVLTTERAVREPYLDLLVTLLWPGGQQRRQVTLLFDPPGYASAPALIDGTPMTEPRRLAQANTTPLDSPAGSKPLSQVRVQSGDTLWGLASRMRPSADISIDQAMLALLQANPGAFPDGNINGLRAGVVLIVPTRQTMLASTPAEAVNRVQAQNKAWRASDGVERSLAVAEGDDASQTQLPEPQVAEPQASEASGDTLPRLTLLSDADLAAERDAATDKAAITTPTESISEQRLAQLTAQWQANREALALSREERERLENEVSTLRQDVAELRGMLLAVSAPEPEPVSVAAPETGNKAGAKIGTAQEVAAPAGPSPSASPASDSVNDDAGRGGLWQMLSDNLLSIAGVAIALLLALWVLVRRRNADDHVREGVSFPLGAGSVAGSGAATPSSFTSSTTPAAPITSPQSPAPGESVPGASQADVPRASAPQTETISEADIFIAYGRFDQARELLMQSLDNDPERHDLRLKLLAVHVELGEREEAQREAARLETVGEFDCHDKVRHLMSRFDGAVEQHADASHGLGEDEMPEEEDEMPEEEDEQVEEADTGSKGYIEYEPPSLDSSSTDHSAKEPDRRHEALQQPSIDYPGSLGGNGDDADEAELGALIDISEEMPRRSASVEHDWEVEEVAFEPLNLDNETLKPGSNQAP